MHRGSGYKSYKEGAVKHADAETQFCPGGGRVSTESGCFHWNWAAASHACQHSSTRWQVPASSVKASFKPDKMHFIHGFHLWDQRGHPCRTPPTTTVYASLKFLFHKTNFSLSQEARFCETHTLFAPPIQNHMFKTSRFRVCSGGPCISRLGPQRGHIKYTS